MPSTVNIGVAKAQGLSLVNIPANKLKNIPAAQPFKTAPVAEPNIKDIVTSVQQSGASALASSVGVKNVNQISSNRIDPAVVKATLTVAPTALNNPLTGSASQNNPVNSAVAADKNLSLINQVSQSVEVNLQVANAQSNNSVTAKYGSKQSSPLSKLFLNT